MMIFVSGTGKTTLWRTLEKAYGKLKTPLSVHVLNPKSMPRQQLLGNMVRQSPNHVSQVIGFHATVASALYIHAGD